jgi:hypothetical protein
MPRSTPRRIRIAPLGFALAANALLVAWLALDKPAMQIHAVAPAMIWMEVVPERVPPRAPAEARPDRRQATMRTQPPVQLPVPERPPSSEAATALVPPPGVPAAPSIDWNAAIGDAVRSQLAREAAEQQGSLLDSKPRVVELPKEKERPHKLGDSEFSNGRTIVWVNERCYLESEILDRHSMPRTVCKNRSMADRRSEDRADAIEQAVKQKRSGSPGR